MGFQSFVELKMSESHLPIVAVAHVINRSMSNTDGRVDGWRWGRRFAAQTQEKNKQVSKVMEKISELETNVLIMRVAD